MCVCVSLVSFFLEVPSHTQSTTTKNCPESEVSESDDREYEWWRVPRRLRQRLIDLDMAGVLSLETGLRGWFSVDDLSHDDRAVAVRRPRPRCTPIRSLGGFASRVLHNFR